MDAQAFREHAKKIIDYMVNYLENIRDRPVFPDVKPNYLSELMPKEAPEKPGNFEQVLEDLDTKIMKGMVHWQHPQFHGYFPMGQSYPNVLADLMSTLLGVLGFSWASCPACTELELVMLDWLGKAIGLPQEFLYYSEGSKGGGGLQCSASDCIFVCMLAARMQAFKYIKEKENTPDAKNNTLIPRLVAYTSTEAHSCIEKAAMISMVKLRVLETNDKYELQGDTVEKAIEEDLQNGLLPFFVIATVGTTPVCSFDNIQSIGEVCKKYPHVWFHVDGAYGGNSFICPELREPFKGIEYADSFNMNPHKWMLMLFDVACMWVKDRTKLEEGLVIDPLYLQHSRKDAVDYRHWTIALSRRFRSLKMWFTFRTYGITALQEYIRNHCKLAKYFESLVIKDERFEIVNEVKLGLVCFRLKGSDQLNQDLLALCNATRQIHMVPAVVKGRYIIRLCVVAPNVTQDDIDKSWTIIQGQVDEALAKQLQPHETPEDMSFIHKIDADTFDRLQKGLHDEETPVFVPK